MSQGEERVIALDEAMERYKQGRCPYCGRGVGEPRGLEFRSRLTDIYCHTCRRNWPVELNIAALRDELALPETVLPNGPTVSIPDLSIPHEDSPRASVAGRFGTFIRRLVVSIDPPANVKPTLARNFRLRGTHERPDGLASLQFRLHSANHDAFGLRLRQLC